jgi:hypothetical protein
VAGGNAKMMSRKAQSNALLWMAEMVIFSGLFVMVGITSVGLVKQVQVESSSVVATEILETLISSDECLRVPGSIAKGVVEWSGASDKGNCIQKYPYIWKAEIKDLDNSASATQGIQSIVNCDFPTYASIPVTIDKGSSGHKKGILKVEVGSLAFRTNPRVQGGKLFLTFDSFADCDMNLRVTENWYEKESTEPDYTYEYNELGASFPSAFKLNETWYGEKTRDFTPTVYKHGRDIPSFSKYNRYSIDVEVLGYYNGNEVEILIPSNEYALVYERTIYTSTTERSLD